MSEELTGHGSRHAAGTQSAPALLAFWWLLSVPAVSTLRSPHPLASLSCPISPQLSQPLGFRILFLYVSKHVLSLPPAVLCLPRHFPFPSWPLWQPPWHECLPASLPVSPCLSLPTLPGLGSPSLISAPGMAWSLATVAMAAPTPALRGPAPAILQLTVGQSPFPLSSAGTRLEFFNQTFLRSGGGGRDRQQQMHTNKPRNGTYLTQVSKCHGDAGPCGQCSGGPGGPRGGGLGVFCSKTPSSVGQ